MAFILLASEAFVPLASHPLASVASASGSVVRSCRAPPPLAKTAASGAIPPPLPATKDPFALLGIDRSSLGDMKAIKRAYRKQAKTYHPDALVTDSTPEDVKKRINSDFSAISAAYEELRDNDGKPGEPKTNGRPGQNGWSEDMARAWEEEMARSWYDPAYDDFGDYGPPPPYDGFGRPMHMGRGYGQPMHPAGYGYGQPWPPEPGFGQQAPMGRGYSRRDDYGPPFGHPMHPPSGGAPPYGQPMPHGAYGYGHPMDPGPGYAHPMHPAHSYGPGFGQPIEDEDWYPEPSSPSPYGPSQSAYVERLERELEARGVDLEELEELEDLEDLEDLEELEGYERRARRRVKSPSFGFEGFESMNDDGTRDASGDSPGFVGFLKRFVNSS